MKRQFTPEVLRFRKASRKAVERVVDRADRLQKPACAECEGGRVVARPGDESAVVRAFLRCGVERRVKDAIFVPKRPAPLDVSV